MIVSHGFPCKAGIGCEGERHLVVYGSAFDKGTGKHSLNTGIGHGENGLSSATHWRKKDVLRLIIW